MRDFIVQHTWAIGSFLSALTLVGCATTNAVVKSQLQVHSLSTSQFLKQIADVPLTGGGSRFDYQTHGLLIDAEHQRVYVACEDNAKLMVLHLSTMKEIGSAQVGESPDVLALDRTLQRLYVASEGGIVSIFSVREDALTKLEDVFAPSAHTIAVNQKTHEVYLPLENVGNQPVLRIMAASNLGSDHAAQ